MRNRVAASLDSMWERTEPWRERLLRVVFGDRVGLLLFLGALVFFMSYWRVGFFITDNWVIANTLANVADGQLHVSHIVYGPESGNQPGMSVIDGRLYGRNYGHVFLALPVFWMLTAASVLVDVSILIAAIWSLLLISIGVLLGDETGYPVWGRVTGAVLGLVVFLANVAAAGPIQPRWYPLVALQIVTLVGAALMGVVLYRILWAVYDRRVGAIMGAVLVVGTPVGFWASIPKRHVLVGLLAMVSFYGFVRSRGSWTNGVQGDVRFRSLAYAAVGVTAWVKPAEAVILFVVLVPLDLATAPSNSVREVGIVGTVFAVSMLPVLLTNYLIAGNPLEPPAFWPSYNGEADVVLDGGSEPTDPGQPDGGGGGGSPGDGNGNGGGGGGGGEPADGGSDGGTGGGSGGDEPADGSSNGETRGLIARLLAVVIASFEVFEGGWERVFNHLERGIAVMTQEPARLGRVFIRSGWLDLRGESGVNLSVLETAPVLGALLALPVVIGRSIARTGVQSWLQSGKRSLDLFAGGYILLLTLVALPSLPLHAQVSVRYLFPIVPFLLYFVARLAPVRYLGHNGIASGLWAYVGVALVGSQLWVLWLIFAAPTQAEALQLHAILGLAIAIVLGGWVAMAGTPSVRSARLGGLGFGAAVGVLSLFLLMTGLVYFQYGSYALGIADVLSETISPLVRSVVSGPLVQ